MKECPSATVVTPENKTTIDDLPLEILSEVASHLRFGDIISLQQTSKKLRESTEAHRVWLALTEEYSARHFHLYRPATGTLGDIKTEELRAWIRRRLAVDQAWRAPGTAPHIRTLDQRDRHFNSWEIVLKLVPGGRWLLVLYKDGSVWYYDLNSSEPGPLPLVPPSMFSEGPSRGVGNLAVFIDQGVSGEGFKLALYLKELEIEMGAVEHGWLQVWQVEPGNGNSLVADRLVSIPCDHGRVAAFALGPQLLVCAMSSTGSPSWIEVIWWKQSSVIGYLRTRFSKSCETTDSINLIGDDRILCSSAFNGFANIYALPEPEHTEGFELDNIPSREPLWSRFLGFGTIRTSPISYDGSAYRLILTTGGGTWGLVVPASNDNNPLITKLSDFYTEEGVRIPGICKAYAETHDKNGTSVRIGYSWDDGGGIPAITYSNKGRRAILDGGRSPILDEESGRLVYISRRYDSDIMVVDFLHQFNERL